MEQHTRHETAERDGQSEHAPAHAGTGHNAMANIPPAYRATPTQIVAVSLL
jgi:hypothetical protein